MSIPVPLTQEQFATFTLHHLPEVEGAMRDDRAYSAWLCGLDDNATAGVSGNPCECTVALFIKSLLSAYPTVYVTVFPRPATSLLPGDYSYLVAGVLYRGLLPSWANTIALAQDLLGDAIEDNIQHRITAIRMRELAGLSPARVV